MAEEDDVQTEGGSDDERVTELWNRVKRGLVAAFFIGWFLTILYGYVMRRSWAPLSFAYPFVGFLGLGVYAYRKAYRQEELGFISLLLHVALLPFCLYIAYGFLIQTVPMQPTNYVYVERVETHVITNMTEPAQQELIKEKYVGNFWRILAVVLLIGTIARGIFYLAKGKVWFSIILLILDGGLLWFLLLPHYNQTPEEAQLGNLLFWIPAGLTAFGQFLVGWKFQLYDNVVQKTQNIAHPLGYLAVSMLVEPLLLALTLPIGFLIGYAGVAGVIHSTSFVADQIYALILGGVLFGTLVPDIVMTALTLILAKIMGNHE